MRKLIISCLLVTTLWLPVSAEDSIVVPEGIKYIQAGAELNEKTKKLIEESLLKTSAKLENLFKAPLVCGPKPWDTLKTHAAFKGMEVSPADIQIPVGEQRFIHLQGALLQEDAEIAAFCTALQDFLKSTDPYVIRRPTQEELKTYWAMIPYDITEPIYVVANKEHAILLHFTDDPVVFWIGELNGLGI